MKKVQSASITWVLITTDTLEPAKRENYRAH